MSTYDFLRHFADSWGLVMMFALFVGVILFAFRPSAKKLHADMAELPLRNDRLPARPPQQRGGKK